MFIKHLTALIIFTVLVLLGHNLIHTVLESWMDLQTVLASFVGDVFSSGNVGGWIKKVLIFLCVPLVVTFVPAAIYWACKRSTMPHIKEFFWLLWTIQTIIFCLNTSFFGG